MNDMSTEQVRVLEDKDGIERYHKLKEIGRQILSESSTVREGVVTEGDILLAKRAMAEGAKLNPPVWASYWEHVLVAPEMGKRLAQGAASKGIVVKPDEVEFLLWLHEVGRIVSPTAYLRESLIGDKLLSEFGLPASLKEKLDSIVELTEVAQKIGKLTDKQLRLEKPYTLEQESVASLYFDSLTPTQRIIKLADNLGKRDETGLFDLDRFFHYLRVQERRYSPESPWPSMNWAIPLRPEAAVLQAHLVEKIVKWLEENAVDFDSIRDGLVSYGPRFVIFVRHGEVVRPSSGIVYNNDEVAIEAGKPEDVVHVSEEGWEQMRRVGEQIKARRFNITEIIPSNQIRARESAEALNETLQVMLNSGDVRFKDFTAPGIMAERVNWEEHEAIKGNYYDQERWGEYGHETPDEIIGRMDKGVWDAVAKLRVGEAVVIVSHGDALAWELNHLQGIKPEVEKLRYSTYPPKGSVMVAVVDSKEDQKIFSIYPLAGWSQKDKVY